MESLADAFLRVTRWIVPGFLTLHFCVPAAWIVCLAAHLKMRNAYSEASRRKSRRVRNVSLAVAVILTLLLLASWLAAICLFQDAASVPIPT